MQSSKGTIMALAIKTETEASLRSVLNLYKLNKLFLVHFDHFTYVFLYIEDNLLALLSFSKEIESTPL